MGNVGVLAAGYLVHKLGAELVAELPPRGFFDIEQVGVRAGVILPTRLPRSVFHLKKATEGGPELLVFLGEAQPSRDGHAFAHDLLDKAAELGAGRVMTFASMASQLHPSQSPRVFGAVTQPDMKADLKRADAELLEDGQIGGLNGVLLGAAAERGLPGVCLLGEIPYFAAGVANPKAARAVLGAFSKLTGVAVDTSDLAPHEEAVDKMLLDLLERLKRQAEHGGGEAAAALPEEPEVEAEDDEEPAEKPEKKERTLDFPTRERIEKLFEEARRDRARGVQLKAELDRFGVYRQYEDRFLDLFKRAG